MARARGAALCVALLCGALGAQGAPWGAKKAEEAPKAAAAAAAPAAWSKATLPAGQDTGSHNIYWFNEITGAASGTDPLVEFNGHVSEEHPEHRFWLDPATGVATWSRPEPFAWSATPSKEHAGREYYFNSATNETSWTKPEILAWTTAERGFWFNNVTGESTWEEPEAMGLPSDAHEGRRYWVVDGAPTWDAPAAFAWRAHAGADGAQYFDNSVTGETTWTRPAALGWSRRSVSKTFWYNSVTGESRRDAPTEFVGVEHESGHRFFPAAGAEGASTWDRPEAASWTEVASEEHGRPYFFNNVTQETVWERPAHSNIAWMRYHEEL